jgi:rod shape-determining protein MreC
MYNLLRILGVYKYSITFWFLLFSSVLLLLNNNSFLKSYYFNSSNMIAGKVLSSRNSIINYFNLKSKNHQLLEENRYLIEKYMNLDSIKIFEIDSLENRYKLISAVVINNSINKKKNYITLNIGSIHGIEEGMGVITRNGIVGKIKYVSGNFSTLISLLNTKYFVSTLIKKTNTLSSINWNGDNPDQTKLLYVPKHVKVEVGDSIMTSSYNSIYPKGILIGTIQSINKYINSNFYDIDIKLFQNFYNLSTVYVVLDTQKNEKILLELKNTNAR